MVRDGRYGGGGLEILRIRVCSRHDAATESNSSDAGLVVPLSSSRAWAPIPLGSAHRKAESKRAGPTFLAATPKARRRRLAADEKRYRELDGNQTLPSLSRRLDRTGTSP